MFCRLRLQSITRVKKDRKGKARQGKPVWKVVLVLTCLGLSARLAVKIPLRQD
jgi:hypothetical protein